MALHDTTMRPEDFSLIKAADIMTRQVFTVDKNTSVFEATKKMSALNVGAVVVTDETRKAVGIFTERDLMNRVVAYGKDPVTTTLSAVMTVSPIMLSPDTTLSDVFHLMQKRGMRHMIFGNNNMLEGIISVRDVNKLLVNVLEGAFVQLQEAMRQLIDAEQMNALGEFTGGIAHEFNQPLNITKIICQSMLRDIQKDRFSAKDAQNDLPEIVNQMNRMSEAVARMSAFCRSKVQTVPQAHDVNVLIANTLKFIRQQYKDHNIDLEEHLLSGLPAVVVDAVRIEQVCFNILSNAHYELQHSGKTPKKITIRTFAAVEGQEVIIEISDNGMGISDENKAKIFQPFFTTKDPGKGTGMGLFVCKTIIDGYKGRIEFESKAGEGTIIRVVLPAKEL